MTDSSVPLRDYCDTRFTAVHDGINQVDRRVSELDVARQEAMRIATGSLDSRLNTMMSDMSNRSATRDQLESFSQRFNGKIDILRELVNGVRIQVAVTAALVSLVVSLLIVLASRWIIK